ncbi:hypothetical protein CONCODRAFT_10025 [Conidiobolus coronatus NRRL 28638]|uniref:ELM2 domain-containing protein n=1 Tax=Conidiobolus coronatus (strain ATCC 28846 / CBS 209.66 / NRRL 28638) TaxID=796925 RepID=A0A137NYM4_CONC2|nr:hypothetical protein CONCODRAFT_10025 [Conidiobolus coronatus NRRL 28638]|eukprot:KXN67842.1 hypothetical protein CONCODRAFT_10025 [Conidiobolus coronatus NRRL 28638]
MSKKDEPRKLIATTHCEKFPVRVIQGKCTVVQPDYINDMESYTQLDGHFYFDELFDRFSLITVTRHIVEKAIFFECSTCVENSREKHEELQSQNALDDRNHKEKSNTHPYLNANKQPIIKDQEASSYTNPPLRSAEGWIYRYFGKNSYLEDLEDPHDSIYPRAGNRVGPKYQATIPDLLSNSAAALLHI